MREKPICKVVAGIFVREGRVLLGKRTENEKRFAGYWEFPGGKIEDGESDLEALSREMKEEIGCKVLKADVFKTLTWDYPERVMDLRFYLVDLCTIETEKMLKEAHSALEWYDLQKVDEITTLPANASILKALQDSFLKPSR